VTTVTEVDRVLGITDALDGAVGPVKARRRGLTAGALLISMASAQLAGVDFVCPAAWVRDVMSPLEVVALR
jgi:hypothetical protein